jgi:hypothetical protein
MLTGLLFGRTGLNTQHLVMTSVFGKHLMSDLEALLLESAGSVVLGITLLFLPCPSADPGSVRRSLLIFICEPSQPV